MADTLEVAKQIDDLGGDPTVMVKDAKFSEDSGDSRDRLEEEQVTIKLKTESRKRNALTNINPEALRKYRKGTRSRNRSDETPSADDDN